MHPPTDSPALEALGLVKSYGERRAVDGIDLVVRPGEVHGLLGRNGAGKTTVLRMLLGLVQPDAGTVSLLGESVGSTTGRVPPGVAGFVDTPRFYPYLSGRENLRLLARLDLVAASRAGGAVEDVLLQVGLVEDADARVSGYSAGMRQRLGLAGALLRSPRLLLLDEPTSALDPAGARDLRAQLRRLAGSGVAVLLSSHDMAEVEDLCSRVTIVHQGRVVFSGMVDDLRDQAPDAVHRLRTSDDPLARSVGSTCRDVEVLVADDGRGLDVRAGEPALDRFVLALGAAGVAVRSLECRERSLTTVFLGLTAAGDLPPSLPTEPPAPLRPPSLRVATATATGVRSVFAVEARKLSAQLKTWVVLAACVASPFAFVGAMSVQSSLPEDTLFGRWVNASGFAVPLVVLGFAASWGFPVLSCVIGGDIFSAEDRYGTWPALLTRGRSRSEIFAGKVLAGLAFSLVAVSLLAVSGVAAGLLAVGRQPLVGLSGTLLSADRALRLVALAWASVAPPVLAFSCLGMLVSVLTQSSVAGVGLPVVMGLVMELCSAVNLPEALRRLLLTPPFVAWHGLFAERPFYGPLVHGTTTSVAYLVGALVWAYLALRRRDLGA